MSTEVLIVISNVGLIVVTIGGVVATILANDKLADITKSTLSRILSGSSPSHGKHEKE